MSGWWDKLPSWVTEALLSGPLTVLLAYGILWLPLNIWTLLIVATILSLFYERKLDANGFSWDDVAERQVGILIGAGLYITLHAVLP